MLIKNSFVEEIKNPNISTIRYIVENDKIDIPEDIFVQYCEFTEEEYSYQSRMCKNKSMKVCFRINLLFYDSCYNNSCELVKILIKYDKIFTNSEINNGLFISIDEAHWKIVEILVNSRRQFRITDQKLSDGRSFKSVLDGYFD